MANRPQQALELASHEVEVTIGEQSFPERRIRHGKALVPAPVHERQAIHWIVNRFKRRQETQTLGDVESRTEEIDHVTVVTRVGRPLDDDGIVPAALETPGERQARDSGSADENAHRMLLGRTARLSRGARQPFPT